jgi:DNA repair metallo-beta-lactamase
MMFNTYVSAGRGYIEGVSDTQQHPAAGVTTVQLPYTSHSTPSLLRQCVAALQPRRIIPTAHVTADNARHALHPCLACATMSTASLSTRVESLMRPLQVTCPLMCHQCHLPYHAIFTSPVDFVCHLPQRGRAGRQIETSHPTGWAQVENYVILQGQAHRRQHLGATSRCKFRKYLFRCLKLFDFCMDMHTTVASRCRLLTIQV